MAEASQRATDWASEAASDDDSHNDNSGRNFETNGPAHQQLFEGMPAAVQNYLTRMPAGAGLLQMFQYLANAGMTNQDVSISGRPNQETPNQGVFRPEISDQEKLEERARSPVPRAVAKQGNSTEPMAKKVQGNKGKQNQGHPRQDAQGKERQGSARQNLDAPVDGRTESSADRDARKVPQAEFGKTRAGEQRKGANANADAYVSERLRRSAGDNTRDHGAAVDVDAGGTITVGDEGAGRIVGVRGGDNRVNALQLAAFRLPVANRDSEAKIVKHGSKYIFLHDEDGFIGYGRFTRASHLDVFESSNFAQLKSTVLKEFQIVKIIEDSLAVSRDAFLDRWQDQLQQVVAQGDIKQNSEIIQAQKKFEGGGDRSMEILEYIFSVSSLSVQLKDASRLLYSEESKVEERSLKFGCFSPELLGTLRLSGVSEFFNSMCTLAMDDYFKSLEVLLNASGSLGEKMAKSLSSLRSSPMILRVSQRDIEYFKSLHSIAKKFSVSDYLTDTFNKMWESFLKNATKPKITKTLTTSIYPYLLTSFLETVTELSARTKRKVFDSPDSRWADHDGLLQVKGDSWDLKSIRWQAGSNVQDRALEKESRFLVHIMDHAKPGVLLAASNINKCRTCKPSSDNFWVRPFKALMRLTDNMGGSSEQLESLIWTTVLRNSMHYLLTESQRKEDEFFHLEYEELLKSLEDAYANFVSSCDSSESCRVTARSIASFAAQMFEQMARVTRPCDAEVLRSQTDFVGSMMDFKKYGTRFSKYLLPLISEFVRYWENRKDFDLAVGANLTYEVFAKEIQNTCDDLHATLHAVFVKTDLEPDTIIDYLRLFNEFLTTFQHINFAWLVQIDPARDINLAGRFRKIVTGKNTSHYEVTDQKAFVAALTAANIEVPKHHVLAIARRLTSLVFTSLVHEASDEQTRVQGTGLLLEAVRKAFIHLDDQINYHSFQQFEDDLCRPFESVCSKMDQFADFKRHLDNLENFFVYTRRQNEIDIDKALEMFEVSTRNNDGGIQSSAFDAEVLKASFTIYDEAFKANISQHYNQGVDILKTIKSTFSVHDHNQWDSAFKRQRIPAMLAAVSAFWSIRESVHVIDTGNSIKPHCIQILCILRLLNVDQDGKSLRKHLAEVLTGQGKSLVLGLLASVLALTGHSVQIVCYSKYLADRDQLAFKEFFEALGITSQVKYGTFDDLANKILCVEVNGSTRYARDLFGDMILGHMPAAVGNKNWRAPSGNKKATSILLIDEVDVFFTKEYYGNMYRLGVCPGMKALVKIQERIWERVSAARSGWFNVEGTIANEIQAFVTQLVRENSDTTFSKFYATTENLFKTHLRLMIADALHVQGRSGDNNRFKLNENGNIAYRDDDGIYKENTYFRYLNAFNYLRLKQHNFEHKNYHNYGYLQIGCGEVSYAELPNEYPVILGVSGTISTLSREENTVIRDSYGIKDVSCMPTFFGKVNLAFNADQDFQIVDNERLWLDAILQSVRNQQQNKRAVIVFFDSEADIDKFTDRCKNDLTGFNKLTGNEEASQLDRRIRDAGVAGSLTLALRAMGRGVDYRTSLTVEQNGGVHVVQTFLSLDVKEETQIKGRTARKDNKGSYELVLCREKLVADGVLGRLDGNVGYAALHAKRTGKAAEMYKENGKRVRLALEKHNQSLNLIKSFATYKPNMRSSYFTKYPFV